MNSDTDEDEYEIRCGKNFSYCLEEKLTSVFIENAPIIICSLRLNCYCYADTPFENKKLFVYIKSNANGSITYERLFREYDRLMGIELDRLRMIHNLNPWCNHIFIECITKKTDIHYELDAGS